MMNQGIGKIRKKERAEKLTGASWEGRARERSLHGGETEANDEGKLKRGYDDNEHRLPQTGIALTCEEGEDENHHVTIGG